MMGWFKADAARFLLESTQPLGVGGHHLGQDFDGDLSTELEIPGLVNFTHTAGAQIGEASVVRGDETLQLFVEVQNDVDPLGWLLAHPL